MEIKEFNRKICVDLAKEIVTALEPIAKKYGLTVVSKGGTYQPTEWTKKILLKVGDSEAQEKETERKFRTYAPSYDLEPDDYGKRIMLSGKFYTIIGIKTNSPKRPIQIKRDDGKVFITSIEDVRRGLGRKPSWEPITLTSKDVGTLNLNELGLEGPND